MSASKNPHNRLSSILEYALPGSYCADDLRLYIPDTTTLNPKVALHTYSDYIEAHHTFRSSIDPYDGNETDKVLKTSKSDLEAILLAFPSLRTRNNVLAAAAWFAVLCIVDDLVEPLDPDTARQALLSAISILRDGYIAHTLATNGHRTDALDTATSKVIHTTHAFRNHTHTLIPDQHTCNSFHTAICDTWTGALAETTYRTTSRGLPSMETYMSVRTSSIGVRPFVVLLESELLPPQNFKSPALQALENNVNVLVGLQNDILGLEKDLHDGGVMNFVSVASGVFDLADVTEDEVRLVEKGVQSAVAWHNRTLELAVGCRRGVLGEEDGVAKALYRFSATHFLWASAARRYQIS